MLERKYPNATVEDIPGDDSGILIKTDVVLPGLNDVTYHLEIAMTYDGFRVETAVFEDEVGKVSKVDRKSVMLNGRVRSVEFTGVEIDGFTGTVVRNGVVPQIPPSLLELAAIAGYNATHYDGPQWLSRPEHRRMVYRSIVAAGVNAVLNRGIALDKGTATRFLGVIDAARQFTMSPHRTSLVEELAATVHKLDQSDRKFLLTMWEKLGK